MNKNCCYSGHGLNAPGICMIVDVEKLSFATECENKIGKSGFSGQALKPGSIYSEFRTLLHRYSNFSAPLYTDSTFNAAAPCPGCFLGFQVFISSNTGPRVWYSRVPLT